MRSAGCIVNDFLTRTLIKLVNVTLASSPISIKIHSYYYFSFNNRFNNFITIKL